MLFVRARACARAGDLENIYLDLGYVSFFFFNNLNILAVFLC